MSGLFVLLQYLLPHHGLSRLTGWLAERSLGSALLIRLFIKRYRVDMSEAQIEDPDAYPSFNAFFTRELKSGVRPLADASACYLCPADGAISQAGRIEQDKLLQAKGRDFSLQELLAGDPEISTPFQDGSFTTIYLSPRDYHRVHMPLAGRLRRMIHVPGRLFSVNQATTARVDRLFARNERLICLFDTSAGPMALVLVGAMIVAGIETVWAGQVSPAHGSRISASDFQQHSPPIELAAGAEMGRFRLGSTVILLFGHGVVEADPGLTAGSGVRMGQALGKLLSQWRPPAPGE